MAVLPQNSPESLLLSNLLCPMERHNNSQHSSKFWCHAQDDALSTTKLHKMAAPTKECPVSLH